MKKCKNCGIEIEEHRIYCSYNCRNIYVNKHLRDYTKRSIRINQSRMDKYYLDPKKCLLCSKILDYDKKRNKFCNNSCAASYNNKFKKGLKYIISEDGYKSLLKSAIKNFKLDTTEIKNKYNSDYHNNSKKMFKL